MNFESFLLFQGLTVPQINTETVFKMITKLKLSNEPIYIDILPDIDAIENECFINVLNKVKRDGGECVYGWAMWQTEHLIEAEAHAVWKNNGKYLDITPRIIFKQILFIEDKNVKFEGKLIDNVRINISNNLLVDDFIQISEVITQLRNKYEYCEKKQIMPTDCLIYYINLLEEYKIKIGLMYKMGYNINDLCFCCENLKYCDCHGKNLTLSLNHLLNEVELSFNNTDPKK